jgi:hypothetical protein
MNDIATIARQNAAAVQRAIPDLVKAGHYVVAEYAGLHFIGTHSFRGEQDGRSAEDRANACLTELNGRGDSTRAELHKPAEAEPVAA